MWEDLEYADENGMPEERRKELMELRKTHRRQEELKRKYPDCDDTHWWCNEFAKKGSCKTNPKEGHDFCRLTCELW